MQFWVNSKPAGSIAADGVVDSCITPEMIKEEVVRRFPKVGDLSQHPINENMAKYIGRKDEVLMMDEPAVSKPNTQLRTLQIGGRSRSSSRHILRGDTFERRR